MNVLLSSAYFAPIQYYSKVASHQCVILERYEHYTKQTYRNRCVIYGANGPQTLSIPVTKGDELKIFTKDIRIDYSTKWTKVHFKAIESAYRGSPFYEYYIDDLIPFFEKQFPFLYEYNMEILIVLSRLIKLSLNIDETIDFVVEAPSDTTDCRDLIHPKARMFKTDNTFEAPVYRQVFEPKLGFFPNLSILDLLFNTGPQSIVHIKESVK